MADQPLTPREFDAALKRAGPAIVAEMFLSLLRYCREFAMGTVPRLVRTNLHNRRGGSGLAGSFRADPVQAGINNEPAVSIYTHSPYARVQEYGATITPKRTKYLTIPLGAAKTAAGVTRGSARNWPGTTLGRGRKGLTIFAQGAQVMRARRADGSRGRVNTSEYVTTTSYRRGAPIFLLRKSVRIPGRLGLFAAWEREAPKRDALLAKAVRRGLKG